MTFLNLLEELSQKNWRYALVQLPPIIYFSAALPKQHRAGEHSGWDASPSQGTYLHTQHIAHNLLMPVNLTENVQLHTQQSWALDP